MGRVECTLRGGNTMHLTWFLAAIAIAAPPTPAATTTTQTSNAVWPPLPDFITRVDYAAWYDKYVNADAKEDAGPAYAEIMRSPSQRARSRTNARCCKPFSSSTTAR